MDDTSRNKMAMRNVARRFRRQLVSLVAVSVALIVVGYFGLLGLQAHYASGFAVHPKVFYAQADKLKVGMTPTEVGALVTIYTDYKLEGKRMSFSLSPVKDGFFPRVGQHIVVYFDGEPQRVAGVVCSDG